MRWPQPSNTDIFNPFSLLGVSLLLLFLLIALCAPVLAPPLSLHQPYQMPRDGFGSLPQPPGSPWTNRPPPLPTWWPLVMKGEQWVHLLGTTDGQWDIYYGVVWGTRTAFQVGLFIEALALALGLLVGSVAALRGGWLDETLMRVTDVFLSVPPLFAVLTLSTVLVPLLGKGILPAVLALAVFGWMGYARIIRGELLSLRRRDFVLAAHAIGASEGHILRRHLLPNVIPLALVVFSSTIGANVLAFAALSFLGIGVEIGTADWGQLIGIGRNWIPSLASYWWVVVWPAAALALFVLGWNLLGDAMRDSLDPSQRRS